MSEQKTRGDAEKKQKKFTGLVIGGSIAVAAGAMMIPAIMAWGFLHPPRRHHRRNPRTAHGIVFERVRMKARDGIRLSGWYVPPPEEVETRGVAIICHGYFGHRGEMLPHLGFLHRAGYAALMFDFRAHGWSGGTRTTFGITEPLDLAAAVDWVKENAELAGLPLAVVSESMGAAIALIVAATDKRIDALVADSAFARFDGAIETRITSLLGKRLAGILAPRAQVVGERILKQVCYDIAPVEMIGRIAPRPLFLLQGSADEVVPPQSLELLYAASDPAHTEVWRIDGARHVRGIHTHREEYGKRLIEFLEKSLPKQND
ncbi:MAG: alpha/beta hydrolase [Fibrella sp.]|nr:alpha/beta hydrolase [Armatimonadota bacterium]